MSNVYIPPGIGNRTQCNSYICTCNANDFVYILHKTFDQNEVCLKSCFMIEQTVFSLNLIFWVLSFVVEKFPILNICVFCLNVPKIPW